MTVAILWRLQYVIARTKRLLVSGNIHEFSYVVWIIVTACYHTNNVSASSIYVKFDQVKHISRGWTLYVTHWYETSLTKFWLITAEIPETLWTRNKTTIWQAQIWLCCPILHNIRNLCTPLAGCNQYMCMHLIFPDFTEGFFLSYVVIGKSMAIAISLRTALGLPLMSSGVFMHNETPTLTITARRWQSKT